MNLRLHCRRCVSLPLASSVLLSLWLATSAGAAPIVVDFDSDPATPVGNGFTSNDSNLIQFSDSVSTELLLVQYEFLNNGLAVLSDTDNSRLRMDLSFVAKELSLDFGNDASTLPVGSQAVLRVFLEGAFVDETMLALNRNGLVDQTISIDGVAFDSATFHFDVPPSAGFTELVDNVVVTPIPEPSAAFLFAVGVLVTRRACRRPQRATTSSSSIPH